MSPPQRDPVNAAQNPAEALDDSEHHPAGQDATAGPVASDNGHSAGPDPAPEPQGGEVLDESSLAIERRRSADRMRQTKHRRRLLSQLWRPRQVAICKGAGQCPWEAPGARCSCLPGLPCRCERTAFEYLQEEGAKAFGGVAIGGLVASTMIACVRADLSGDPRAVGLKIKLLQVLASDLRKRQDLEQRERRLQLAEGRAAPPADLQSVVAALAGAKR